MYFLDEGFTFRNFLIDVLTISIFVFWFWLVITVAVDLFRRSDISGWGKAGWVIGWIVFPFIAVLAYLIFRERAWRSATSNGLSKRAMNLGEWLDSVPRMKSKSLIG
jgi:hypothetical protein